MRAFRFRLNPAARKLLVYADGRLLGERSLFGWKKSGGRFAWKRVRFRRKGVGYDLNSGLNQRGSQTIGCSIRKLNLHSRVENVRFGVTPTREQKFILTN